MVWQQMLVRLKDIPGDADTPYPFREKILNCFEELRALTLFSLNILTILFEKKDQGQVEAQPWSGAFVLSYF